MNPSKMTDIETFLDRVERKHKPESIDEEDDYADYPGECVELVRDSVGNVIIEDGSFADD